MGPVSRYLGPWVPEPQLWQDPVPAVDHELIGDADIAALKEKVLDSGLSVSPLVATAWAAAASASAAPTSAAAPTAPASASRRRRTGRSTSRPRSPTVLSTLERIQQEFNAAGGAQVSLADLIVLGGCAAVEQAAKDAGHDVTVPFAPGRTDASQEQTDVESFAVLEPKGDGFRNYVRAGDKLPPEQRLLDRAEHADAHRSRDDGAGRRHARARTPTTAGPSTASSPTGPARSPTTSS